jgi:HAMP domain-containing protein
MRYPRDIIDKVTYVVENLERISLELTKHILSLVILVSVISTSFSFLASGLSIRGLLRKDFILTLSLVGLGALFGGAIGLVFSSSRYRRTSNLKRQITNAYMTALSKSTLNPLSKDTISESKTR